MVPFQPKQSDKTANPYVDAALPKYVIKLRTPDSRETFSGFAYIAGKKPVKIRLMPFIQPTIKAKSTIAKTADIPENKISKVEPTEAEMKNRKLHDSG